MSSPPRASIPKLSELSLELVTPRLRLRPVRVTDADAYFVHARDAGLARYLTWAAHTSVDETRNWLRASEAALAAETEITWALELDGAPVGCVGLHGLRWQLRAVRMDRAELGYWLAPAWWGRGLMTEAAGAVTRWGFTTLGLHKVFVQCFEANTASRRVIEKLGFRFVGRADADVWRDGVWHAHLQFEQLAP